MEDPVAFAAGVYVRNYPGATVKVVVPGDVRLSRIGPALARLAREVADEGKKSGARQ